MRPVNRTSDAAELLKLRLPIVVYDCETTGLKKNDDRVIQFAAILLEIVNGKYTMTDHIDIFINPGFPVSEEITSITGITNEQLAGARSEAEAFPLVKAFFDRGGVISGYNIRKFDNYFIDGMYRRNAGIHFSPDKILDVYEIVKELINPNDVGGHLTLESSADYYCCAVQGFHNALVDVVNTAKVLSAAIPDFKERKNEEDSLPKAKLVFMKRQVFSKNSNFLFLVIDTEEGKHQACFNWKTKEFKVSDKYPYRFRASDMYAQMEKYSSDAGFKTLGSFK